MKFRAVPLAANVVANNQSALCYFLCKQIDNCADIVSYAITGMSMSLSNITFTQ